MTSFLDSPLYQPKQVWFIWLRRWYPQMPFVNSAKNDLFKVGKWIEPQPQKPERHQPTLHLACRPFSNWANCNVQSVFRVKATTKLCSNAKLATRRNNMLQLWLDCSHFLLFVRRRSQTHRSHNFGMLEENPFHWVFFAGYNLVVLMRISHFLHHHTAALKSQIYV